MNYESPDELQNELPVGFQSKDFELSPYQVIAILIGLGLLVWAAYAWFNQAAPKLPNVVQTPKMSASEIAAILST